MNHREIVSKDGTVNGIRIHFKIAGSGSPLLLLHGSPLTSRSWLRILPIFAATHTVISSHPISAAMARATSRRLDMKFARWWRISSNLCISSA